MKRRTDEHHGHAKTNSPEYRVWSQMLSRCTNPRASNFKAYGGAGISVCESWRNSFVAFLADMGPRPQNTTLDRINNDGDYTKENCRWATHQQQAENRSSSHLIEIDGIIKTVTAWARVAGISDTAMLYRVRRGILGVDLLRPGHHGKSLLDVVTP